MADPVLRSWRDDDLVDLVRLNNAALPAVSELTTKTLHDLAAEAAWLTVATDEQDHVLGFVLVMTGPGADYNSVNYQWFCEHRPDGFAYVDRVVVDAARRSRGIGEHLYRWVIAEVRGDWPVLCAEVNVRPRNDGSLRFHDRFGFVAVGEQDSEGGTKRVSMLELTL